MRKLQQHHVAQILESHKLVTALGHQALSKGDVIHTDLDFLTKFANIVREVRLHNPYKPGQEANT